MSMYRPPQVTEREPDGTWEDCTWASGVMLNNAAHGAAVVPSDQAEYQALRVAGGDGPAEHTGDGSNALQLQVGIAARYGWTPRRLGAPGIATSWAEIWAMLVPGVACVLQGSMSGLSTHYRRWDPPFAGDHAVYVQREDALSRLWFQNPLAPASFPGEWLDKADAERYWTALRGGAVFAHIGALSAPIPAPKPTVEDPNVRVVTVTIVEFPPRAFVAAGSLQRYSASAELTPLLPGYTATVDATAVIEGNTSAPTGSGFLRLASGGSKGRFVKAAQVTLA